MRKPGNLISKFLKSLNQSWNSSVDSYSILFLKSSGKPHGPEKSYLENGKLQGEYHHIDGKIYGEEKHYNKDGTLNRIEGWEIGTRKK